MLNLDTVPWAQANWMGVTWVGPRLASIAPAFVSSAKGMVKLCTGAQDYLRSNQQAPHVCMLLENPQHTSCCAAAAPHPLLPHDCIHTCSRPVAPPESIHRIHCTQTHTAAATARSQQPCQRDLKFAPTTANTLHAHQLCTPHRPPGAIMSCMHCYVGRFQPNRQLLLLHRRVPSLCSCKQEMWQGWRPSSLHDQAHAWAAPGLQTITTQWRTPAAGTQTQNANQKQSGLHSGRQRTRCANLHLCWRNKQSSIGQLTQDGR
jgi:hypothetical protein